MAFCEPDKPWRLREGRHARVINIFIGSTGTVSKWAVAPSRLPGVITQRLFSSCKGRNPAWRVPPCREHWTFGSLRECPAAQVSCKLFLLAVNNFPDSLPVNTHATHVPLEVLGCIWEAAKQVGWDEELLTIFSGCYMGISRRKLS